MEWEKPDPEKGEGDLILFISHLKPICHLFIYSNPLLNYSRNSPSLHPFVYLSLNHLQCLNAGEPADVPADRLAKLSMVTHGLKL